MKLASYATGGCYAVGLVSADGQRLLPVPGTESGTPEGVLPLVERWDEVRSQLGALKGEGVPLESIELTAPLPRPRRNIFCVGKNYANHVKEFGGSDYDVTGGDETPSKPVFFTKATTTVVGPGAPIEPHWDLACELDYEAELAVIIGTGGRRISRDDALEHVWGYTIVNDVTARDLQRDHQQWFLGKSLDGFCPMGPWAVTADEVTVDSLEISCLVNGELRQSAKTSALIFDVPALIEMLSAGITLLPGDVIATGTPDGVGIGFNPPKFLRSGDEVVAEISGLGALRNRVA